MKRQLYGLISLILFLVMVSAPIAVELIINSILVAQEFDIYGEYRTPLASANRRFHRVAGDYVIRAGG